MIRLVIIAAALLFIPVASAADCAWVLWSGVSINEVVRDYGWNVVDAYEKHPECIRAATKKVNAELEEAKAYQVGPESRHTYVPTELGVERKIVDIDKGETVHWSSRIFLCFPAGTDPRPAPRNAR